MTARWPQVKEILNLALERPPDERRDFLDRACAGDDSLRREVEILLSSAEKVGSFMEQAAIGKVAEMFGSKDENNLKIGERLNHYEILSYIGAGGMGEIYLAEDTRLDRRVAVKILNEKFSRDEPNLRRFIREAKAASALNHPNILVVHEIGEAGAVHYIVSELVEGKTLRGILNQSALELPEILDISIQIASALTAAHASGIVHRDIKPENVMVRPDGYAKVLDFGLAKLVEQKPIGLEQSTVRQNETEKGVILGTVNYMSPEQAQGARVDARSDVFSFGAVLYEMIAGRTPFGADSMSETLANLINAEPLPLSRFAVNVPGEFQRIVSKMLKKDKDERYQTMKDILTDLKSLRETLAFDRRLEQSHPPGDTKATVNLPEASTAGEPNNQTRGTNNALTRQIKRHKPLAAFVLIALIVGAVGFGYYFLSPGNTSLSATSKKSLAVLPFVNASQNPDAEYLSDGITESIINNLSQIGSLRVMSKNSAFRFKQNQTDTRNIASLLGVETLVTGDIRQVGNRLVINVRLIDASDDSQIWGNQYVSSSADIIKTQTEIAQAVAQNLRLKLNSSERQRLAKNYTENNEAYQLYLRGRFHIFRLTPPEVTKGISYFQRAIEIDPNYALAYTGISDGYRSLALGAEMPPNESLSKSKAAANKAIEIDETLTEGYVSLGSNAFWQWDWNAAENHYKRALELNPNNADLHLFYAHLLSNTGRHAEAIAEVTLARQFDPLFPFGNALEGQFLLHAGRTDEALDRLKKTFDLEPNFWIAHLFASSAYIEKGMYEEAVAEARKASELSPFQTISAAHEAYALAKSGKPGEARIVLNRLLKLSGERFVPPYHLALIYNGLGEKDETFAWLERAYQEHDPKMAFLKVEPKWNNLRGEPRFQDLMRRMGLPQ